MNSDDAGAFDALMALTVSDEPSSQTVLTALKSVIDAHDSSGLYMIRSFTPPLPPEEVLRALDNPSSNYRQAAVDTLNLQSELLPKFVSMIVSDPSLNVRAAAQRKVNAFTKQTFRMLDKKSVVEWWEKNKASFGAQ